MTNNPTGKNQYTKGGLSRNTISKIASRVAGRMSGTHVTAEHITSISNRVDTDARKRAAITRIIKVARSQQARDRANPRKSFPVHTPVYKLFK